MKSLFVSAVLFFSNSVFANEDIGDLAKQLAEISASGMREYTLTGDGAADLVRSYVEESVGLEEDTEFLFDSKDISETDESVYGTTDAKVFLNLLFSAVHYMDEGNDVLYPQEAQQKIKNILKDLKSTPVIYSWNPNGASVCGTFFTTPVLIDPQAKKAYEINFYKFEGC